MTRLGLSARENTAAERVPLSVFAGGPQDEVLLAEDLAVVPAVPQDVECLVVGEQLDRLRRAGGQVAAHHERGTGDEPQRQQADLLGTAEGADERDVGAGGEARLDGPAAAGDGPGVGGDLPLVVREEHVVNLDEVDPPFGELGDL
ncbi:hypothetical protein QBA54_08280 [Streptomyces sp. B21-108]|uniref:hypothetical protein n=1 Tax=Streptomyces sp. B21-108 TaxID=3039419 RepID=UPI002FEE874F